MKLVGDKGREASRAAITRGARNRAADLAPIITSIRVAGAESLREIAAGLNSRGIPTARGESWTAVQVARVLERIG